MIKSILNQLNSILLIDDDSIANYLHESLISKLELSKKIVVRLNGREALNYIEEAYAHYKGIPSLILCDINMPVLNGFEFIEKLRQNTHSQIRNIPLVILSSSACEADVNKMQELKVSHCLTKPLTRDKLLMAVNAIYRRNGNEEK